MSDVDELADDLGVDLDEVEEESNEVTKATVTDVDTKEQIEASDKLVGECKKIYEKARENDLSWRWDIGNQVNDAYENETNYEKSILKRLSSELDIAVSDLSRFRKFFKSFDLSMLIDRAKVGYTWSHFKMINDIADSSVKTRMISLMEQEDEAPKTKELQKTINEEKEAQFTSIDDDGSGGSSSDGESKSKSTSPLKPVNASLKLIDKLGDNMTDIFMQEDTGIDWDTDAQEEKYNQAIDELRTRVDNLIEITEKIWKKD